MNNLLGLEFVAFRFVDWNVLILDLMSKGMCVADIARILNIPRSTIYSWMDGQEPRYYSGQALVTLHSKILGIEMSQMRLSRFKQAVISSS